MGNVDPLFYYIWIDFVEILATSEKAYHIKYTDTLNIWLPKSICRDVTSDGMHVHKETFFDLKARATKPRMFK